MGKPSESNSSGFVETVDEIMRIYRSLPRRPSLDEVEAAMGIIRTVENEESLKIEAISNQKKPPDVPEELFILLQEFQNNSVLLQSEEQKKEAVFVLSLEKKFEVFDGLLQRVNKLVNGDESIASVFRSEEVFHGVTDSVASSLEISKIGKKIFSLGESKSSESEAPKGVVKDSSLKSTVSSDLEKLGLMKVASLIEICAKDGAKDINLQGKLMDQIEWLPLSIGKLSETLSLNLAENRIMALPTTISGLKSLMKLDLHSNQLINLPACFGELFNLTDLDLHSNQLKSLPPTFGNLTNLVNLDLSSNKFSYLPESMGKLTSLKTLDIETNELEEFPYTIGHCTSLVQLRANFNQLKALPEAIGKLENLEVLTLHYNRIKGLPTTVASLSSLKELDVSFNEIESVPESLCFATSLVKLNLGKNFADLRALPKSIGNLEMLEELDISDNQIRVLPDSFRLLSKLRVLYTDETPLEVPPIQVAKLGAQAVVRYMAELHEKKDMKLKTPKRTDFWVWFCILFCSPRRNNGDKDSGKV
ncbi:hypothetical protein AMTRI_Chr13g115420 [Amborella trichopoda]|uniref:Disease resistance R13L4/SHOC-2-like LRR domain-containing protein n=1 Tax=Amborella trichopoda TaxID=13333 RepID=W1PNB5_AMBTC|nr:plant intracellular Ras-group-related LRR protein 5 [Amborella trichopoda]ERN09289.1 hypothetical protein AMTR_s00149p00074240 [Amborella trichopoda]|eukprot:XP_006847708.1 plant intracellular Ras-group-related LRR protein 5 [Amborella trichopoda]